MNTDFKDLLSIFQKNSALYLIVGGYAYIEYAEPRYTKDLDIWIDVQGDNPSRVYRSLLEFGAPVSTLDIADFAAPGFFFKMGVPPVRIDILMSIRDLEFVEAWQRRHVADLDGVSLNFLSLDDLITAKRAAGRPQDLLDVEELLKVKKGRSS